MDATWAPGYVRSGSNEFTPSLDEFYYLTPPAQFARNHFPEDPNWSLLADLPLLPEFRYRPFRTAAAQKYRVQAVSSERGILHAAISDTLHLRVELRDALQPDTFVPPLPPGHQPGTAVRGAVPLAPATALPARVLAYTYVLCPGDEWLLLRCNGEVILCYKVEGPAGATRAGAEE
ncbi:MAG: hypothetical protein EOO11_20020 [Chitinophagaceae bacterium]|nr:MAG: hypothetical protein EOO11_20020 [Chitinophagaceae bacterium]